MSPSDLLPALPAAVLFDMDGTLVDSLEDLAACTNRCLARLGREAWPVACYRGFVGEGVTVLAERALRRTPEETPAPEQVAALRAAFLVEYEAGCLVRSRPFPGIPGLLAALAARRIPCALLTNKPHALAVRMVEALFAAGTFARMAGQREGMPRKPDPTGALALAAELAVEPGACWLVGDSAVDVQTARAAGMTPVGVLWGYRDEAELRGAGARWLVQEPAQLVGWLAR